METDILVRSRREFGEVITDPFKMIFRNLKAIVMFNLLYVFLPLAVGMVFFGYLQVSLMNMNDFGNIPWVYGIVGFIALIISGLHTTASTFSIVKSAEERGFDQITFEDIHTNFKSIYIRNLGFFAITSILFIFFSIVVGLLAVAMPILTAIVMIFVVLFFLFYVGPLIYLAMSIYLYNVDLGYLDAINNAREYMNEKWGSIFGTFMVSGMINGMLQYTFTIPFMLLFFMMNDINTILEDPNSLNSINVIQNIVVAFLSSFLIQYIGICMYLKYFDLYEQKYGRAVIDQIENIGEKELSYFDNEGEY